ncbi:MAG: hypothetical protein KBE09_00500 [Candidatus Pacebacteria bacterium]|nr:hypothetical protein [Candidatus Paceibacterota bacterium]
MYTTKNVLTLLAGVSFAMSLVLAPVDTAHAQVSNTIQCNPSEISGFVPYVYDGQLHSFDYFHNGLPGTILRTTVGGITLTPNYTSVWISGTTTQKVHVDVPGWYSLSGNVPVVVEVLSRTGCASTQTFAVMLPVTPVKPTYTVAIAPVPSFVPTATPTAPIIEASQPVAPTETPTVSALPSIELSVSCSPEKVALTWDAPKGTANEFAIERANTGESFMRLESVAGTVLTFTDENVSAGEQYAYRVIGLKEGRAVLSSPTKDCGVPANAAGATVPTKAAGKCGWASQWWTVFLIAQIVTSLIIINLLSELLRGNGWRFTLALFLPFALLLGLWFAFDVCRSNQWFPIMVTLITLATLFAPTFFKDAHQGNPSL